jgi:hypothetical protein
MEELTGVDVTPESRIFRGPKDVRKSKSPEKKNRDEVTIPCRRVNPDPNVKKFRYRISIRG